MRYLIQNLNRWFKKQKKKIVVAFIVFVPIIMFFIPVKLGANPDDIDKKKEYYILKLVYGDVTDGGWYIVNDWDNQLVDASVEGIRLRYVKGNVPSDYISDLICYEYRNNYIVYGTLDKNTETLNIDSWEIMPDIYGGTHKTYLTIYDLKWSAWLQKN